MTQQVTAEQIDGQAGKRSRGPGKSFPPTTFEDALFLPKGILEHGNHGEIQRLALLGKLGISPNSNKTRALISGANKYGLTEGGYQAPSMAVTNAGRLVSGTGYSPQDVKEKVFELAIKQFRPFDSVYDKLKEKPLKDGAVPQDEFRRVGVPVNDCQWAASIFMANLRFLGLVQDIAGNAYIQDFDQALQEMATNTDDRQPELPSVGPTVKTVVPVETNGKAAGVTNRPALHIDVQVHIDPTSSAEQIDHIFASMAKHLYGN